METKFERLAFLRASCRTKFSKKQAVNPIMYGLFYLRLICNKDVFTYAKAILGFFNAFSVA
jgi:hypothetical protein